MSKKNKIIISILCAMIAALLAANIVLLVLKFNTNAKLETPTKPIVLQSENLISIETSKIENAENYTYEITTANGNNVLTFERESNILILDFLNESENLKEDFNIAGIYHVRIFASSRNDKSYYSPVVSFERNLKLNTPNLSKTNSELSWNSVNNAEFYEIFVSSNEGNKIYTTSKTSISLNTLKTELNLQPGLFSFCVKACSNNNYFIDSDFSNVLQLYIH